MSAAENLKLRSNAEIAQLVEHNLAPKEIRFPTLARECETEELNLSYAKRGIFVASEWESSLSLNERSRKSQVMQ